MSMTTVICRSGRRLTVSPSKTATGMIEISVLNAAREVLASCCIDPHCAEVFAQALAMQAVASDLVKVPSDVMFGG